MNGTVSISVNRYFPETQGVTKNGKPKRCIVDVRKMEVRGSFIFTDRYVCTLVKRHGERYVSVKQRKAPARAWWDKRPIKEDEYKWEKEGNYSLEKFEEWLQRRIVGNAKALVSEMLTAPPENIAA